MKRDIEKLEEIAKEKATDKVRHNFAKQQRELLQESIDKHFKVEDEDFEECLQKGDMLISTKSATHWRGSIDEQKTNVEAEARGPPSTSLSCATCRGHMVPKASTSQHLSCLASSFPHTLQFAVFLLAIFETPFVSLIPSHAWLPQSLRTIISHAIITG